MNWPRPPKQLLRHRTDLAVAMTRRCADLWSAVTFAQPGALMLAV